MNTFPGDKSAIKVSYKYNVFHEIENLTLIEINGLKTQMGKYLEMLL